MRLNVMTALADSHRGSLGELGKRVGVARGDVPSDRFPIGLSLGCFLDRSVRAGFGLTPRQVIQIGRGKVTHDANVLCQPVQCNGRERGRLPDRVASFLGKPELVRVLLSVVQFPTLLPTEVGEERFVRCPSDGPLG